MLRLFRFIYLSSAWMRRRLRPQGQVMLGTCLIAAALGVNTDENLAHSLFTLSAALLLLDALATALLQWRQRRQPAPLSLQRHLPGFMTAGQAARYHLRVRNTGPHPLEGARIEEALHQPFPEAAEFRARKHYRRSVSRNVFDRRVGFPDFVDWLRQLRGLDLDSIELPRLNPGQGCELGVEAQPLCRALVHFHAPALIRPSPLGLFWRSRTLSCDGDNSLCVLPRPLQAPLPPRANPRHIQPGGVALALRVGDSEEFRALRDYRPGDPLRAVHWRSWARSGKPVVREYQDEFFSRHALVLDTAVPSRFSPELETAIALATALVARPLEGDSLLDVMFVGERVHRLTLGRGLGHTDALLRVLAALAPSPSEDIADLLQAVRQHAGRLSSVLAILLAWDPLRRQTVDELRALGLQVHALIVAPVSTAERDAAEAAYPGCLHWITPEAGSTRP